MIESHSVQEQDPQIWEGLKIWAHWQLACQSELKKVGVAGFTLCMTARPYFIPASVAALRILHSRLTGMVNLASFGRCVNSYSSGGRSEGQRPAHLPHYRRRLEMRDLWKAEPIYLLTFQPILKQYGYHDTVVHSWGFRVKTDLDEYENIIKFEHHFSEVI